MYGICLIVQTLLLICTICCPTGYSYMLTDKKIYKIHLWLQITVQGICLLINIAFVFLLKDFVIYMVFADIILMGIILMICTLRAKKRYFQRLKQILMDDNLLTHSPSEIRRYIAEKYDQIYFLDDIRKCLMMCNKL